MHWSKFSKKSFAMVQQGRASVQNGLKVLKKSCLNRFNAAMHQCKKSNVQVQDSNKSFAHVQRNLCTGSRFPEILYSGSKRSIHQFKNPFYGKMNFVQCIFVKHMLEKFNYTLP
jgi:hypothetical protein